MHIIRIMKPALLLLISALLLACRSHYPVTREKFTISPSEVNLKNGENMAYNICGGCHYDYKIKSFIGKEMRDLPKIIGKVYSANLTEGHVLSHYNDAELF